MGNALANVDRRIRKPGPIQKASVCFACGRISDVSTNTCAICNAKTITLNRNALTEYVALQGPGMSWAKFRANYVHLPVLLTNSNGRFELTRSFNINRGVDSLKAVHPIHVLRSPLWENEQVKAYLSNPGGYYFVGDSLIGAGDGATHTLTPLFAAEGSPFSCSAKDFFFNFMSIYDVMRHTVDTQKDLEEKEEKAVTETTYVNPSMIRILHERRMLIDEPENRVKTLECPEKWQTFLYMWAYSIARRSHTAVIVDHIQNLHLLQTEADLCSVSNQIFVLAHTQGDFDTHWLVKSIKEHVSALVDHVARAYNGTVSKISEWTAVVRKWGKAHLPSEITENYDGALRLATGLCVTTLVYKILMYSYLKSRPYTLEVDRRGRRRRKFRDVVTRMSAYSSFVDAKKIIITDRDGKITELQIPDEYMELSSSDKADAVADMVQAQYGAVHGRMSLLTNAEDLSLTLLSNV